MNAIVPSILAGLSSAVARLLPAFDVGPVAAHQIVERQAARREAVGLGVIGAVDQAHRLAHHVAVEPGRAERVLGHHPARREDDEIGIGAAGHVAGAGQHGEDRRVGMVEADRADRVEARQIVAVGRVIAVPGDDVERRMVEGRRPQRAERFLDDFGRLVLVLDTRRPASRSRAGWRGRWSRSGRDPAGGTAGRDSRRHSRALRRRPRRGTSLRAGRWR